MPNRVIDRFIHQTNINASVVARGVALCVVLFLGGCGSGDPFSYVQVSGKVTYDDGSLIQYEGVSLTFFPQAPALGPDTFPQPGIARFDPVTGHFDVVTSHKYNDGLVRGKHKVTLTTATHQPLPTTVIPLEYATPETTPLLIDTAQQPFELKIRKPPNKNAS